MLQVVQFIRQKGARKAVASYLTHTLVLGDVRVLRLFLRWLQGALAPLAVPAAHQTFPPVAAFAVPAVHQIVVSVVVVRSGPNFAPLSPSLPVLIWAY